MGGKSMNPRKFTEIFKTALSHFEKAGIFIFLASVPIYTQLNWARKRHNYNAFEIRLFLAIAVGFILSSLAIALIKKAAYKKGDLYANTLIEDISHAASFGFLFLFGSASSVFIILSLVGIVLIFICKRNPTARNAAIFAATKIKRVLRILFIEEEFAAAVELCDHRATIILMGNFRLNDSDYLRFFTANLIDKFKECIENKAQEIKINFSELKDGREEIIKPIVNSISHYFGMNINWGK
jgi:hypothetical protein